MTIAYLTPEYPHPRIGNSGGLGTSIKNLAEALAGQGHIIHVLVAGTQKDFFFEDNGIKFYGFAQRRTFLFTWFTYRKFLNRQINFLVAKENIQVIEAPDWTGLTAFMRFKVPLVIRFHGSDTYFCHLEKRPQKWKNRWFETLAVQKAAACIAPTRFAGDLSAKLLKVNEKKVTTLHYGLRLEDFINPFPLQYDQAKILYIGTLIRKKGVFELPKIFETVLQSIPDARLTLIGADSTDALSGSLSTWKMLQQQFSEKALQRVEYLGKIPYGEVKKHLCAAHVCVFPTFAETLGMVTIEAMALQKAVVNSNIGWANELIDDGENGFLVHPTDTHTFAEKIVEIISQPALTEKLGKAARQKVEKDFDMQKIAKQNLKLYAAMIENLQK